MSFLVVPSIQARGVFWIVEQPRGSYMEFHDRLQTFCRFVPVFRVHLEMRDYGADSEKGTWLYSNFKFIEQMLLHKQPKLQSTPRTLTIYWFNEQGVKRARGGPDLKNSQTCPATP